MRPPEASRRVLAYTYARHRPRSPQWVASHPLERPHPMTRSTVLNGLFIVAGFSSAAAETLLYKLALVAIVVLLHELWFRAARRRAARDSAVRALQRARSRAMGNQDPLDDQEDYRSLPPVAAAAHPGRW